MLISVWNFSFPTVSLLLLMARIAAMKNVLSPISETRITDKDSTKPWRKPEEKQLVMSSGHESVHRCFNLVDFQIPPLCSVTLKAGSSVILMLDTPPVSSGIQVGSTFSGFGSMWETCGRIVRKSKQAILMNWKPPLSTVRRLCWGLYKRKIDF